MEAITINTEKLFDLDNINSFAKEWKEAAIGNKVLAYYCSHMPEEILYAADILPYRLSGTGVTDDSQAETYLSPFMQLLQSMLPEVPQRLLRLPRRLCCVRRLPSAPARI